MNHLPFAYGSNWKLPSDLFDNFGTQRIELRGNIIRAFTIIQNRIVIRGLIRFVIIILYIGRYKYFKLNKCKNKFSNFGYIIKLDTLTYYKIVNISLGLYFNTSVELSNYFNYVHTSHRFVFNDTHPVYFRMFFVMGAN